MQDIIIISGLVFSGFFYMLGGREMKIKSSWLRDVFCPIISCSFAVYMFPHLPVWKYALLTVLQIWACVDYFNWFNRFIFSMLCNECGTINEQCGKCTLIEYFKEKHWWNWLLIGIVSSAKWLLVVPINPVTVGILIFNALLVMIVSNVLKNAEHEEFCRGMLIL